MYVLGTEYLLEPRQSTRLALRLQIGSSATVGSYAWNLGRLLQILFRRAGRSSTGSRPLEAHPLEAVRTPMKAIAEFIPA
jgi:hypothetical protein